MITRLEMRAGNLKNGGFGNRGTPQRTQLPFHRFTPYTAQMADTIGKSDKRLRHERSCTIFLHVISISILAIKSWFSLVRALLMFEKQSPSVLRSDFNALNMLVQLSRRKLNLTVARRLRHFVDEDATERRASATLSARVQQLRTMASALAALPVSS